MKKLTHKQVASLSPEVREKYEKELRRVSRNIRILKAFIALVVFCVVFGILSVTVLFNISSISVDSKSKRYSESEIVEASGLSTGDNMFRTDFDAASANIEKTLPYIKSAVVSKSINGKITISVTEDKADFIIKVADGYALADDKGKVLELLTQEPEDNNYAILKLADTVTAVPGKMVGLSEDEEDIYNSIMKAIANSGIKDITGIDMSDTDNIYAEYQHRFRLHIGAPTQLNEKFEAAVKTILMENEANPNVIGEINLTIVKKVYVKPLDSLDDTEQ